MRNIFSRYNFEKQYKNAEGKKKDKKATHSQSEGQEEKDDFEEKKLV